MMAPTLPEECASHTKECSSQQQQESGGFDFAPERSDLNQYWYSDKTIAALAGEVASLPAGQRAAMVSTPSIYFALPPDAREGHRVLDFDEQWKDDPGFTFYDFNDPDGVPQDLHHAFDLLVIDPPFITREVWEKYAQTARLMLKEGLDEAGQPKGKLLCSTVRENQKMMAEILDVKPQTFRPSIPNLVYQYDLYTNYSSPALSQCNPEIDEGVDDTAPAHQGLRVEHPDDQMVIPTHKEGGKEVPIYTDEYVAARLAAAMEADPNSTPAAPEVFSPEVTALMARREAAGALKKVLEGLAGPVESTIKARVKLSKAEESDREAAQRSYDAALEKVNAALATGMELAGAIGIDGPWPQVVADVGKEAKAEMRTKKQLIAFLAITKTQGQELFKLQKAMLVEIKELKAHAS